MELYGTIKCLVLIVLVIGGFVVHLLNARDETDTPIGPHQ